MAVVFRAFRADGEYMQEAVVKLIRGSSFDRELVRRFRLERQVLAWLNHPNIARLLDGGVAEGRPYLVMEYVRGEDILSYCDDRGLDLRDRLRLFDGVCAGVQHAHANLVVHRDLKPAHVLIDETGQPKLLDFGIRIDARGRRERRGHRQHRAAAHTTVRQPRTDPRRAGHHLDRCLRPRADPL